MSKEQNEISQEERDRLEGLSKKQRVKFDFSLGDPSIERWNSGESFAHDAVVYPMILNGRKIGRVWGSIPGTDADERPASERPSLSRGFLHDEDDDEDDEEEIAEGKIRSAGLGEPFEKDLTKIEQPLDYVVWANLELDPKYETSLGSDYVTPEEAVQITRYRIMDTYFNLKSYLTRR